MKGFLEEVAPSKDEVILALKCFVAWFVVFALFVSAWFAIDAATSDREAQAHNIWKSWCTHEQRVWRLDHRATSVYWTASYYYQGEIWRDHKYYEQHWPATSGMRKYYTVRSCRI